uniref:Uncharacterized protein n=1 Tax=Medicago truncatula TaxID=3880 RepID=I3SR07_MEDTR|nr:unknown [Medicago truncatula]
MMFADTNDIFLLCFLLFKKKNSQQVKRSKKTCKASLAKGNGNTALTPALIYSPTVKPNPNL